MKRILTTPGLEAALHNAFRSTLQSPCSPLEPLNDTPCSEELNKVPIVCFVVGWRLALLELDKFGVTAA